MKLMIDTANLDEIKEAASWGILSGVTTNPSLIAKEGGDFKKVIKEICGLVDGPISAEVIATDAQGMITEGREYSKWHGNVVIKVPMTEEGIKACSSLSKSGIRVNVTLVFTPNQALLAARAGAFLVSPFVGRLDDIGEDGMQVVRDIIEIYKKHGFKTHVLAASIRNPVHVIDAAKAGADYATIPYTVMKQMFKHPLTDSGIKRFLEDWEKAKTK
ncbi:MAG: fructose-6-phosphate aldolase [Candidatus Micrarchaeota archaeon]